MRARTHQAVVFVSLGGDTPTFEGEATVCFTVSPGRPETPPSYSHGGLPAEPATVEDITVTNIDGAAVVGAGLSEEARALESVIEASDDLLSELLQAAVEDDIAAHDDAMERRWEERRMEER